jgi:hypothetical protein
MHICQSLQSPTNLIRTQSHSRKANDKPTKYGIHSPELHHNHSDPAHRWAWKLQQRYSLMQARSGLFAASQSPALRIVHAHSRFHLRCRRGRIRWLCLRCLNMWSGCALPARPHTHPSHEGEQQLRDGEHRALPSSSAPTRPAARSYSALSVWHPVPSELERMMLDMIALPVVPLPCLCRRRRTLRLTRILGAHAARVWGCRCGVL